MKERWILNGKYMNGDEYFEAFDNIHEMLDTIQQIYWIAEEYSGLYTPDECVNPFSLTMENDNTETEINKWFGL